MPLKSLARLSLLTWVIVTWSLPGVAQEIESLRRTPLVELVQKVKPTVLPLYFPNKEQNRIETGTGVFIHRKGILLTNHHVAVSDEGVGLFDGKQIPVRVIGRVPEKDLAILETKKSSTPYPAIPIGVSHDVLDAESVLAFGNPGGRGITVTSGIVSSPRVILSIGNALILTQFAKSRRDDFIQFDAAVNKGCSGGPLVNMDGEMIGLVTRTAPGEQNVGFAIPIDRIRQRVHQLLRSELQSGLQVGIRVKPGLTSAIISSVQVSSPASAYDLSPGDQILRVNGQNIANVFDWNVELRTQLSQGERLNLSLRRGRKEWDLAIRPKTYPPFKALAMDGLLPGTRFTRIHGRFNRLPDFAAYPQQSTGVAAGLDLVAAQGSREDHFAVLFEGWINIPETGIYRAILNSDDGSRMYFHEQLLIDHDGNHPPTDESKLIYAEKGLHPARVEYFESVGGQSLSLRLELMNRKSTKGEEVPLIWYRKPENTSKGNTES